MTDHPMPSGFVPWPLDREFEPIVIETWVDDEGFEQAYRVDGWEECPKCNLIWPRVAQPDMWDQTEGGIWIVTGWWGGVVCEDCGILLITQPDGTPEAYNLQ